MVAYGKLKPDDKCVDIKSYDHRINNLISQLHMIMKKYMPKFIYMEQVPQMNRGGIQTAIMLGCVHGAVSILALLHHLSIEFINVGTWRSQIGLFTGKSKDKERDNIKVLSIQKANELFNINLKCMYTKNGKYDEKKSDDDIADSILIYASQRDKYKVHKTKFGYVKEQIT